MPPTVGGSGGERMWCILSLTYFIFETPPDALQMQEVVEVHITHSHPW